MSKPQQFGGYTLYRIYYGEHIIYLGRTMQPLNRDDKAPDELSVSLPDVEWKPYETALWEKLKRELAQKDAEDKASRNRKIAALEKDREMRQKRRDGEITENEYCNFWESEVRGL